MGKRIGILSLSPPAENPRVLRQAASLAGLGEVTLFGPGPAPPALEEKGVDFVALGAGPPSSADEVSALGALLLGRVSAASYDRWFWKNPLYREAGEALNREPCHLLLANGWQAAVAACEAAKKTGARVLADFPDFAPAVDETIAGKAFVSPAISHFIKKMAPSLCGSLTVSPGLARLYRKRFKLEPIVVRNAPELVTTPDHAVDGGRIHIIHHGGADQARALADLIEIIRLCDRRFLLHYMLVGDEENIRSLTELARKRAPNRVFFHETVKHEDLLSRIWRYDMSLVFQRPAGVNGLYTLPRKFFESIAAGLALVAGPTPEMQELILRYQMGCVSPSFSVRKVAEMLNALSGRDIEIMRSRAREAAKELCAEKEHKALVRLCGRLLEEEAEPRQEPSEAAVEDEDAAPEPEPLPEPSS